MALTAVEHDELTGVYTRQAFFYLSLIHICNRIRDYYLKTTVEISAGIYEIRDRSKSLRIMCDRAHLAADSIKKNHMIQVAVYDDTHRKKLIQEQMIINELDDALKEKQFKAFFQPKYDMCTDRVKMCIRDRHTTFPVDSASMIQWLMTVR